jgi:hypothetical protein
VDGEVAVLQPTLDPSETVNTRVAGRPTALAANRAHIAIATMSPNAAILLDATSLQPVGGVGAVPVPAARGRSTTPASIATLDGAVSQTIGDNGGQAPDDQAVAIDQHPLFVNFRRFGGIGFHGNDLISRCSRRPSRKEAARSFPAC